MCWPPRSEECSAYPLPSLSFTVEGTQLGQVLADRPYSSWARRKRASRLSRHSAIVSNACRSGRLGVSSFLQPNCNLIFFGTPRLAPGAFLLCGVCISRLHLVAQRSVPAARQRLRLQATQTVLGREPSPVRESASALQAGRLCCASNRWQPTTSRIRRNCFSHGVLSFQCRHSGHNHRAAALSYALGPNSRIRVTRRRLSRRVASETRSSGVNCCSVIQASVR